jgi:hypothetical protein
VIDTPKTVDGSLTELIALPDVHHTVGASDHVYAGMKPTTPKERRKFVVAISKKDLPLPKVEERTACQHNDPGKNIRNDNIKAILSQLWRPSKLSTSMTLVVIENF